MWDTFKRISVALILILVAASVLLFSDWHHRKRGVSGQRQKRVYKIGLVYFAPDQNVDLCLRALRAGLKDQGLIEGDGLELQTSHAQAEMVNIPALLQNYDGQELDVIMTLTTPCLTAACATVKTKPVVFTMTYDPIAAGAGKSFTDHLPNMTGIGSFPPLVETVELMREAFPGLHTVGIIYNNSEANSRKVIQVARDEFQKLGMKLEEVSVTSTTDVYQAALSLTQRQVEILWAAGDNTVRQGFESMVKVADSSHVPLICNDMGIGKAN